MRQSIQHFNPSPAYRVLLALLLQAREERGLTQDKLAQRLSLPVFEIRAREAGAKSLDITQLRAWLLALDAPFALFTARLEDTLDNRLTPNQHRALQVAIAALPDAPSRLFGDISDLDGAPGDRSDLVGIESLDDIPYGVWAILEPVESGALAISA